MSILDSTAMVWFCHLHFHHNHSLFSFFAGKLLIQIGRINKYWITHVWVRTVVSHNALCHVINLAPIFSVVSREAWSLERKKKNNKQAVVTSIVGYKYTLSIIQIIAHLPYITDRTRLTQQFLNLPLIHFVSKFWLFLNFNNTGSRKQLYKTRYKILMRVWSTIDYILLGI